MGTVRIKILNQLKYKYRLDIFQTTHSEQKYLLCALENEKTLSTNTILLFFSVYLYLLLLLAQIYGVLCDNSLYVKHV